MKQTSNAKELFGEIRSCANGATCDLNQLSRWIHEVENDSPGVDAYGYVTHHLGGTPRLWKLLKDQPLDALELLGSLKSPAEYPPPLLVTSTSQLPQGRSGTPKPP